MSMVKSQMSMVKGQKSKIKSQMNIDNENDITYIKQFFKS